MSKKILLLLVIAATIFFVQPSSVCATSTIPSPAPLLEVLAREKKLNDKDIYVISLKFIPETKEIMISYLESPGFLISATYRPDTPVNSAKQLDFQDVTIPNWQKRIHYMERAPHVDDLLYSLKKKLNKVETAWGAVK